MTDEFTPMTPTMRQSSNSAMTAPTLLAAIDQVKKSFALNEEFGTILHGCHLEVQSVRVRDVRDGEQKKHIIDSRKHLVETLTKRKRFLDRFATDAMDTLTKQLQLWHERRQPHENK